MKPKHFWHISSVAGWVAIIALILDRNTVAACAFLIGLVTWEYSFYLQMGSNYKWSPLLGEKRFNEVVRRMFLPDRCQV